MKSMAGYLKKKANLKIKDTIIMHPQVARTKYFRGSDLIETIEAHKEEIEKLFRMYVVDLSTRPKIEDFLTT